MAAFSKFIAVFQKYFFSLGQKITGCMICAVFFNKITINDVGRVKCAINGFQIVIFVLLKQKNLFD